MKFKILFLVLILFFGLSCNSATNTKDNNDSLKVKDSVKSVQSVNQEVNNNPPQKESGSDTDSAKVAKEFEKYSSKIEGSKRDCWNISVLIGDLNGDGIKDGLAFYGCDLKDNHTNGGVPPYSGIAIFISKNGELQFIGTDENLNEFIPDSIRGGIIYGEKDDYGPDDPRCCPSIKKEMEYKLEGNKLKKIK
ncbi:MAG TPA: hypothetical protein VNZ45_07425 [Bacteroidia bacterium]|jgi:hypothetical protein|nr:hypothetical protein [Bacteroidia bacterium]